MYHSLSSSTREKQPKINELKNWKCCYLMAGKGI
jgi:hypothetical protein